MTDVAVNVTLVPAQIVVDGLAAMLTLAATLGLTVSATAVEVVVPPQVPPVSTHRYW